LEKQIGMGDPCFVIATAGRKETLPGHRSNFRVNNSPGRILPEAVDSVSQLSTTKHEPGRIPFPVSLLPHVFNVARIGL
jgi:hypothetical protein